MKTLGFCILHYGKEYLEYAIQSVLPVCDKIVILYSQKPSQGHNTDLACPESREELMDICAKYNCDWIDVNVGNEGAHTNEIYKYSNGYDCILRFDADEVFDTEDLKKALDIIAVSPYKRFGINGFKHFWKSFNHICTDYFQPVRFVKPNVIEDTTTTIACRIYHFSYAQNDEIIKYKLDCSGHKDEFRKEWLTDIYEKWTPETEWLHPASLGVWNKAIPFDKNTLPDILKTHPRFND